MEKIISIRYWKFLAFIRVSKAEKIECRIRENILSVENLHFHSTESIYINYSLHENIKSNQSAHFFFCGSFISSESEKSSLWNGTERCSLCDGLQSKMNGQRYNKNDVVLHFSFIRFVFGLSNRRLCTRRLVKLKVSKVSALIIK